LDGSARSTTDDVDECKGCASAQRGANAREPVTEIDPTCALLPCMTGPLGAHCKFHDVYGYLHSKPNVDPQVYAEGFRSMTAKSITDHFNVTGCRHALQDNIMNVTDVMMGDKRASTSTATATWCGLRSAPLHCVA
jgi:hypothetical protein